MLLQMRGRVSAPRLASEFEVSVRTIYRDVDALSAAGVPIYAETGRNGGIALHDGYRTRLTGLTSDEAAALPLASLRGIARDLGLGAEAASAHLKLLASLPVDVGASAQRISQCFHLDPVAWYQGAQDLADLPRLASAIWRERQIEITYERWSGRVARRLSPLGLVLKGGTWYLVASVEAQLRTYKVSNILTLEILDEPAFRPPSFDLQAHWSSWSAEFEARLTTDRARVRISAEGLRLLRDTYPALAAVVQATRIPSTPGGWIEADLPLESLDYSAGQILRLGCEIEVLAPQALRDRLAQEARDILEFYSRP